MAAWEQLSLMPEPEHERRALSEMYSVPLYRRTRRTLSPKYAAVSAVSIGCDECFARQVETKGKSGSRHQAKVRRTGPATQQRAQTVLNLCRAHAQAWRERDEADVA